MGLTVLILGLVIFLGVHLLVTMRDRRALAIAKLGVGYRIGFALAALIGLGLIVWGFALYRQAGYIELWSPPRFTRHIAVGLMLFSVILILAAYLPGHIKTWTKHPMLAAIKIWALAHLISNGDVGSIILFGSFLAWAVYARIAVKRRERLGDMTRTGLPNRGWANDALAMGLGIVIFLSLGYIFHPAVIGVPVFGA